MVFQKYFSVIHLCLELVIKIINYGKITVSVPFVFHRNFQTIG